MINRETDVISQATVISRLAEERQKRGIPMLFPNESLGRAALSMAQHLARNYPDTNFDMDDFSKLAKENGYSFLTEIGGFAYYLSLDLPATVDELSNHLANAIMDDAGCAGRLFASEWQDCGFGITSGFGEDNSYVSICCFVGLGFGADTVFADLLNERRRQEGVAPLRVNYRLRRLAREIAERLVMGQSDIDEVSDHQFKQMAVDEGYPGLPEYPLEANTLVSIEATRTASVFDIDTRNGIDSHAIAEQGLDFSMDFATTRQTLLGDFEADVGIGLGFAPYGDVEGLARVSVFVGLGSVDIWL